MFLINSRYTLLSATHSRVNGVWAYLIPKLRYQFAEFLNQSSLKRLSILYSSTCVGLGYGHYNNSLRGFSRKHGFIRVRCFTTFSLASVLPGGFSNPDHLDSLQRPNPMAVRINLLRPPFVNSVIVVVQEY